MIRTAGPKFVKLAFGGLPSGEWVELDVTDIASLRGEVTATVSIANQVKLGFLFSCSPKLAGTFFEVDEANRLALTTKFADLSLEIDCRGFARARFGCVSCDPLASDSVGIVRLTGFSTVNQTGLIRDPVLQQQPGGSLSWQP